MARGVASSAIRAHGDVLDVMCRDALAHAAVRREISGDRTSCARHNDSPALHHAVLVMYCGYGEHLSV